MAHCGTGTPLISIITVTYNAASQLEESIWGVKSQTYPNREHIVIDGGSKDGTLDILKENDPWLGYWVSENDNGIYDAMDKGIEVCSGDWVYFLGVDDAFYSPETLSSIFEARTIPSSLDMVLGQVFTDRGLTLSRFNGSMLYKNAVYHQSAFYARHIFDRFRYCNSSPLNRHKKCYDISGDYRLNLMLQQRGARYMRVEQPIARCRSGVSMEGRIKGYLEEIRIRHEFVPFHKAIFFDFFTVLRYLHKRVPMSKPLKRFHETGPS
ncbi:MAG: glycosyltransferase [Deltaproteobacteria bacterium]|nr:glycosyltransferase [Deltaproteobacteria bacterium]